MLFGNSWQAWVLNFSLIMLEYSELQVSRERTWDPYSQNSSSQLSKAIFNNRLFPSKPLKVFFTRFQECSIIVGAWSFQSQPGPQTQAGWWQTYAKSRWGRSTWTSLQQAGWNLTTSPTSIKSILIPTPLSRAVHGPNFFLQTTWSPVLHNTSSASLSI